MGVAADGASGPWVIMLASVLTNWIGAGPWKGGVPRRLRLSGGQRGQLQMALDAEPRPRFVPGRSAVWAWWKPMRLEAH